jgi:WD40 repeat protein
MGQSLSGDHLRTWDAATGNELARADLALAAIRAAVRPKLRGGVHEQVYSERFSPDYQRLMVYSSKGTYRSESGELIDGDKALRVRCWDTTSGKQLYEIDANSVRFSNSAGSGWLTPDGRTLIATSPKGVHLFDAGTGKVRSVIEGENLHGRVTVVLGNNRLLVGGPQTGVQPENRKSAPWQLWEIDTGKEVAFTKDLIARPIQSPDQKYLYWIANKVDEVSLVRWDIAMGKQASSTPLGKGIHSFQMDFRDKQFVGDGTVSPDGKHLLMSFGQGERVAMTGSRFQEAAIMVRDTASGKVMLTLKQYTGDTIGLGAGSLYSDRFYHTAMFLPGTQVLSIANSGRVDIWSLAPKE